MTNDLFPQAMAFVWRPDNDGQPFHVTANDPGGATAWGVTYATWSGWQRLHGGVSTLGMFRAVGQGELLPLYRALYWNACACGAMGAIGIQVFDVAMGSGPETAARFLQAVVDVEADGQIGPVTLAALRDADPARVNTALFDRREAFYASLLAGAPKAHAFS